MRDVDTLLVLRLRPARSKSRALAEQEAVALLRDLGASVAPGGPFADERGVAWVSLPAAHLDVAAPRLRRLGYTRAVDALTDPATSTPRVRWHKREFGVQRIWEEDPDALREEAVDRREFRIESPDGVRAVRGYRGDGGSLSRRGLAVPDARLLANLVRPVTGGIVLDPFAGVGGILLELGDPGVTVVSIDIDPVVAPGLLHLTGGNHLRASTDAVPLGDASIDGIATETPFDATADQLVADAFREIIRCLRPGGRVAVMAPERQAVTLRSLAAGAGMRPIADAAVDRKGLLVTVVAWERQATTVLSGRLERQAFEST